jgi:serine/threonine protein kinase
LDFHQNTQHINSEEDVDPHQITQHLGQEGEVEYSQQLQAGATLENRYLIQSVLGIGGMGAVYRARDMHFPNVTKLVAVKEMVNRAVDPMVRSTIVRNFEREANLLASLNHRAIPNIYDYFTLNDRSYLVIEYIEGHDLEALINNSNEFISQERVIRWAVELCDVLSFLHNHKPEPVIFRDMKPSNVMINKNDHAVLIDFGIAKHFDSGQKGTMIGTEGYSPPEQYRGEATPLADLYALGATLHHVLTRRDPRLEPPFSFGERRIRQFNPGISPQLESAIEKALHYNPSDRFQDAISMKDALLGVAKDTGLLSHVEGSIYNSSRSTEGIKPLWEFECEDEIRGNPKYHNGVVYTGCYDHNLYAINAEDGKFLWKYATEAGVVSKPAIFEKNVLFGSEDHRVHSVFTHSGKVNWTYYTDGPIRSSPHIAEGHIFIGSDDGFLHAINALTGRRAWKIDCGSSIRSTPLVFKDMVFVGNEAGDFFCIDYSGSIKWRFQAKRAVTSSPIIHDGVVYFGSVDTLVYAIDTETGWIVWRYRLNKPTISTPFIKDNLLFIGGVDGKIYCLNANNARDVWQFEAQNQITGSPIVHNDSLYFGSVDGKFYCLEYQTGRLRWKFATKGPITSTPIAHESSIFVGSTDRHLYALLA